MKQGKKIVYARRITLTLVFAAVVIALAFDTGFGTPSAFGVNEFFLLCPLGGLEAMLASKSFIPAAALSAAVVLIFVLIFGRAWCAWGCPAPVLRNFFKRKPGHLAKDTLETNQSAPAKECSSCPSKKTQDRPTASQMVRHLASSKRLWILLGILVVTFCIGFPIFCLVCPIGLTFGSVSSLWHLLVDKQVTASVIVFPLALVVELIIYRKWCVNLCPIAGLLNIFGQFAKLFRPRIEASTCLLYNTDTQCNACTRVCPENINMHTNEASLKLGECTRCGECIKHCPTSSVSIKVKPSAPVVRTVDTPIAHTDTRTDDVNSH